MLNAQILTEKLEQLRIRENIAGMSVAVTDREKVIYNQGFGFESAMRPEIPTCPDALYKIASITKTFTAIMILRLVEEGTLDLDLPIINYIPWLTLSNEESAKRMTLRHLLTHTAGMPPDIFLEEGSRDEDTIDAVVKATLPTFQNLPTAGECGYQYSSWGYNVIGTVASSITGNPLSVLMDEFVLKRLGTERTTFDYFVASTYPLSMPHRFVKDGTFRALHHQRFNTVYHAGAGLFSNTTDLCKLLRFFLNDGRTDSGEQLLTPDSLEQMTFPYNERTNSPGSYYGLGLFVNPHNAGVIYGHTGNYDPYNSSVFYSKEKGYGVVTLINSHATDARNTICKMVFDMLD